MSRQWIRAINLTVGGSGGTLDLSSMRIKFDVKQTTIQTPGHARIRVYNLAKATALRIVKQAEFKELSLSAGYVDHSGVIFSGSIVWAATGRESPTDTFLDIVATDGDKGYNWGVATKTLAAGSTLMDHVNVMADAMKPFGVTLGYVPTQLLQQVKFPRAVTFHGMARDYLRHIAATIGATWSIQNGELRIVEKGKSLGGVVELNSQTGLIGMPVVTPVAIYVTCLINPDIKIHSQVHINQASINPATFDPSIPAAAQQANLPQTTEDGIYNVYVVDKTGDTHKTPWYMNLMVIAAGQLPTKGLVSTYGEGGSAPADAQPAIPQEG